MKKMNALQRMYPSMPCPFAQQENFVSHASKVGSNNDTRCLTPETSTCVLFVTELFLAKVHILYPMVNITPCTLKIG